MLRKINPLLPCIVTVLTLAIVPEVQAARLIPVPTVPVTSISVPGFTDTPGFNTKNGTTRINNISVMTNPNELASVYNVCFEFGTYSDVFTTNRPPSCVNVPSSGQPEFLGNQTSALLAAGQEDPNNGMPTSDGTLTALINAFNSSNQVLQVIGNTVFEGQIFDNPTIGSASFIIPYAFNATLSTVQGVQVSYVFNDPNNILNGTWTIENPMFTLAPATTQNLMYARFGLVSPAGVPEPSGVFGVFLAGCSLLVTTRRR